MKPLAIQTVDLPWLHQDRVSISVLRADLVDPLISGNKFFKLHYNLEAAREQGRDTIVSFGGAWSNHLHALAAAGQRYGFRTVGIVRGEEPAELNACLADAQAFGMQLRFVSREQYRAKHTAQFLQALQASVGPCYVLPEGGANLAGIRGCQVLLDPELAAQFSHVMLACGTGTTMTGLITSVKTPVLGVQVLKGKGYLQAEIAAQLERYQLQALAPWQVLDEQHRGGYAKTDAVLAAFMTRLAADCPIPFEPVYSGKLMLALFELITQGYFDAGARILVVHGGGLQGLRASS